MNRQWIRIGLVTLCATVLMGCSGLGILRGSGNVVTETREVSTFAGVDVCCGMHLVLRQAETTSVEIVADDNFLPEIESEVVGQTLHVRYRKTVGSLINRSPSQPVTVYVTTPALNAVTVSGGGQLAAEALATAEIAFSLSGGSQGEVAALTADTLTVELSGGSHLTVVSGEVAQQSVEASGGSEYTAEELATTSADVSLSSGSHARIWVADSLIVDSSGGSDLAYYGTPRIEQEASGGSKTTSLGAR